jgi:putative endopeptidase
MAVHLGQGGLGLPDRSYYLLTEAGTVKAREAYVKYIGQILKVAGTPEPDTAATSVMAFETELAKASRPLEDLRDPLKNYNQYTVGRVERELDPSIAWHSYFAGWKIHPAEVIVGQPEFYKSLDALLAKTPVKDLRAYMRFQLISTYAPFLTRELDQMHFDFYSKELNGQQQPQPRWKRALRAENGTIGFILGKNFVKEYFPPAAKKRYSDLIEAFRSAYHKRIDRLTWMSPATKAKAHQKLSAMVKKVGYPDKWKDYSTLKIGTKSYCDNAMTASKWGFHDELSKLGKPVDRKEWGFPPQTFNAYYDPANNEIVMPAAAFAIPGMKDSEIDEALMYGNAGASWIGHEMTHGFDDEGRHFDSKGNLHDWWTKSDAAHFEAQAQLMAKQFDAYEPIPGIHISGKATLGENIADYGGLLLGLDAFRQSKAYKENKKIGGFTPMQRFFLGYTLSWLDEETTQSLRSGLLGDVHAPAKWRTNGPLSNLPDFYAAFGVKPGQPMWRPPALRPHIW